MIKRRNFLKSMSFVSAGLIAPGQLLSAPTPVTFKNGVPGRRAKGKVHTNGKPCKGIAVTDGFTIVTTNDAGNYLILLHPQAKFVYISLPAGYAIPHNNSIAKFYVPITSDPTGVVANFELQPLKTPDDKHVFLVWSDPQVQTQEQAMEISTVSIPDLRNTITAYPAGMHFHAMGCGDLAWDKLEFFDTYKEHAAAAGIPFFQVIGNHDLDLTTAYSDEDSATSFLKQFGPSYYSFNRGKIHYVAIDNVFFLGTGRRFIGYITQTQLDWLAQDLALVPEGNTVIVCLHIPSNNGIQRRSGDKEEDFTHVVANREKLYQLLAPYKAHIMSGHTHFCEHVVNGNLEEHIHGAVCGAWWTGPICWDGAPKGYGVYEMNGSEVQWYYKSIGKDRRHQLRLYAPGSLPSHPDHFIANVWNWDPQWKVEWLENSILKGTMQQITALDPMAVELYEGPDKPAAQPWINPVPTDHLFIARPNSPAAKIEVQVTDRFGNRYNEVLQNKQ